METLKTIDNFKILKEQDITSDFRYTMYLDHYKNIIHIKFQYLNNKFIVQRSFPNSVIGMENMEHTISELSTVEKFKSYLGI